MEQKKYLKISLSTCLFVIALIVILVMGFIIYNISSETKNLNEKIADLEYDNNMTSFNKDTNDVITSTNTTIQSNSDNDATSTTNIKPSLDESEALQIATDIYKKAYNLFSSEEFRGLGNYSIVVDNVELQSSNKINISLLNNIFSDNAIKNIKNSLVEYNGEYYDTTSNFLTSIEVSTIFRTQAGNIKPLSLKVFNDDCIVATGQIQNSNNENIMTDDCPYYIVFIKENGK